MRTVLFACVARHENEVISSLTHTLLYNPGK